MFIIASRNLNGPTFTQSGLISNEAKSH
jgi:hypothetical protein